MKIKDDKFWAKTTKLDNGCVVWEGSIGKSGYGIVRRRKLNKGNVIRAHRYAYYLRNGVFAADMTCHTCDNPKCVNPYHLYNGTAKNNTQDQINRGRRPSMAGTRNPGAKLSEEQVFQIKKLISENVPNTHIAKLFPVTHSMVSAIKLGKAWA